MWSEIMGVMGVAAAVVMVIFGLGLWADNVACHAQWDGYGKTDWGMFAGCMVERNGVRIPASAIRDLTP